MGPSNKFANTNQSKMFTVIPRMIRFKFSVFVEKYVKRDDDGTDFEIQQLPVACARHHIGPGQGIFGCQARQRDLEASSTG